eukprot:698440_1
MQFDLTHKYLLIFTIIYLQCISLIKSQYSQIWYDPMEDQDCNDWTQYAGAGRIDCGYTSSGGCEENPCVKIESHDTASSSLSRTTNIAAYSSLQLQVSVSAWDLESDEYCEIYCQYDGESLTHLATINPPDDQLYHYFDSVYDLPPAVGKTDVTIHFLNYAGADDFCYWDNVYLRGIPDVSATPQPTSQPSLGESQYSQIWYDPMEDQDCNGWTQYAGAGRIDCGYTSSGGCEENPCVKIESHDTASSSLSRTTNITPYSSVQLQVSVSAWALENG